MKSSNAETQRNYSYYAKDGRLVWQRDEPNSKRISNIYFAGSLVAEYSRPIGSNTVTVSYQHTDALGSPIAKTNSAGTVIETSEYEPYGKLLNRANDDRPGYTGHVMDAASGLTYMQQRYYDPQIGRFLSVDPVTADSAGGTNFNRYWYANNNPYRFTDPDGRTSFDLINKTGQSFTPAEVKIIRLAYRMADLTERAVKAGGDNGAIARLDIWKVKIDPRATTAIEGKSAIAATAPSTQGGKLVEINTTVSGRLAELSGTGEIRLTGAIAQKGDQALEYAGLHEFAGHGNPENRLLVDPLSNEMDASARALDTMQKDPAMQNNQPERCETCYEN